MKKTKIIIVGLGGQGAQTIAKILALAAVRKGLKVSYIPQFGVEQRGTPSLAFVALDEEKIGYPLFESADWLLILHPGAVAAAEKYVGRETKVVFDSSLMAAEDIGKKTAALFGLPAAKLANEKLSSSSANLVMLGKISQLLDLPFEIIWPATQNILEKKLADKNKKKESRGALLLGYKSELEEKNFSRPTGRPGTEIIISKGGGKRGFLKPELCKGCGICLAKCPVNAIKFGRRAGAFVSSLPEINLAKCSACGNCFLYCPEGAIKVKKDS